MKRYVLFAGILVLSLQLSAYAFGGTPPEENQGSQQPAVFTPASQQEEDRAQSEMEKAQAERNQLNEELDKVEKYLWTIDLKIADARKTKNSKKLLDLMSLQQDVLEHGRQIKGKISTIEEKYPSIKGKEAGQALKPVVQQIKPPVEQNNPPVTFIVPPTSRALAPQITTEEAAAVAPPPPVPAIKKAATGKIVYHYVVAGDTLMGISRKYFGTASFYRDIAAMNGIEDSGLQQGMMLKIDLGLKNKAQPKPAQPPTL
jgi:hypothetical protein